MIKVMTASQSNKGDQPINSTKQKTHLVSIIIPNYNHAQYISDAIQSVLDQNYGNFEIIVVDDGSTDNSRDVVAKFENQVRYIWQENQGLSAARNTGIKAAKGTYIGLLDADDMYEPNFLSTLASILETNPGADGVYCGYQFVDHLNQPLPQREARLIPDGQLYYALIDGNFLVPESMLVCRHCYENVGLFDETLRACEDWDMWLRISSHYNIIGVNQILTRHRILPGSMSTDPLRMQTNRLMVLDKHFGSEIANDATKLAQKQRAYGRAFLKSAIEYLQIRDETRASDCLHKLAQACPDLLTELDTFYQISCGAQPKGFLGSAVSLDIEQNARALIRMLDEVFSKTNDPSGWQGKKQVVYANAYFALGLLSYNTRQIRQARRYLLRALFIDPKYSLNKRFVKTLLKSFVHGWNDHKNQYAN